MMTCPVLVTGTDQAAVVSVGAGTNTGSCPNVTVLSWTFRQLQDYLQTFRVANHTMPVWAPYRKYDGTTPGQYYRQRCQDSHFKSVFCSNVAGVLAFYVLILFIVS